MITLTVDETMLALLNQANQELAEIRDAGGKVIGFFAPIAIDKAHLYADVAAHCDREELQRRKEEGRKTYTTKEVLDHLKSLEKT
jgi:hypothetical protein